MMRNVLTFSLGCGVLALFWLPYFRDVEGFLTPQTCLIFSLLISAAILIHFWSSPWRRATGWFVIFILGQAIALQLIDAGKTVHYQHYRLSQGNGGVYDRVLLGLIGVQAILVIFALKAHIRPSYRWLQVNLGRLPMLALIVIAVFLATFPSQPLTAFALDLIMSGFIILTQLACLLIGVLAMPKTELSRSGAWLSRFVAGSGNDSAQAQGRNKAFSLVGVKIDKLAFGCALWVTTISVLLAVFAYERHPHVADEFAYLFHARYFAQGQMSTPAPPVIEAVDTYLMDCNTKRCISPVPPGWPAMLAVGVKVGVPWLVNPLLAGLNVLLLFILLRLIYNQTTARVSVLLLAASPWYLLLGMSMMTHIFSLTCTLIAASSVALMHRDKRLGWAVPGGSAIGMLSLTRPLEGMMVACVLGLATLFISGRWYRQGAAVALGVMTLAVAAWVFPYNKAMTGSATTFPIMAYADKALGPGVNALGFGPDKGVQWGGMDPFPGHGLRDVVVNAVLNVDAMNVELFGWSIGSLVFILFLFALRSGQPYLSRFAWPDNWMLLFVGVIFGFQSLYWFSGGPDFGARYYFLIIIPLIALTAQGIRHAQAVLARTGTASTHPAQVRVLVAVLVMSVSAMVNFLPWRAIDKYHNYRSMRPDVRKLLSQHDFTKSIILVNAKIPPDLISAMTYSSLDPYSDEPLVYWNRNAEVRSKILAAYKDRTFWILDGPSLTGAGYRVVRGPVSATELMQ